MGFRAWVFILGTLLPSVGCAAKHVAQVDIPKECIHVTMQSFTKPCREQPGGNYVCDGVVLQASCVRVKQ